MPSRRRDRGSRRRDPFRLAMLASREGSRLARALRGPGGTGVQPSDSGPGSGQSRDPTTKFVQRWRAKGGRRAAAVAALKDSLPVASSPDDPLNPSNGGPGVGRLDEWPKDLNGPDRHIYRHRSAALGGPGAGRHLDGPDGLVRTGGRDRRRALSVSQQHSRKRLLAVLMVFCDYLSHAMVIHTASQDMSVSPDNGCAGTIGR